MGYNYELAKSVLSENDKHRLICVYLNCEPTAINWAKAASEYGAASVDSMRVMTRTALKKITDVTDKGHEDVKPTKVAGGGKKRKLEAEDEGDDVKATAPKKQKATTKQEVEDDDDGTKTVLPKKGKAKKGKKASEAGEYVVDGMKFKKTTRVMIGGEDE